MESAFIPQIAGLAGAGIAAGLWLLARGFGGYRTATRIADTGTSNVAARAAGEVRAEGVIEPSEVTLISPSRADRASTPVRSPALDAAADRHRDQFIIGLSGAVLAIASAMAGAIMLGGGFGS